VGCDVVSLVSVFRLFFETPTYTDPAIQRYMSEELNVVYISLRSLLCIVTEDSLCRNQIC
jgi:hypothetical protein